MEAVFGADKARRLRIVVGILAGLAVLSCGVAAYVLLGLAPEGTDRTTYGVVLGLASAALLGATSTTWWKLPTATPGAYRGSVACGAGALVVAFLTSALPLGFVLALVGLATLFLTLAAEHPAADR